MMRKINKQDQIQPPFKQRGGCVPYAIATICNDESIMDQYPAQDDKGQPISHGFYHASMMMAASKNAFCFFECIMAKPYYYDDRGKRHTPKGIKFAEFSHSRVVYYLSANWKNKHASKFVFLLDVHVQGASHCIGMVLDIITGQAIVIDVQKPYLIEWKIGKVFSHYRVLRVAMLYGAHNGATVLRNDQIQHLSSEVDGSATDV